MSREKFCELHIILKDLENTLKEMQSKKKWLTIPELAGLLNMSTSTIQTFKDRLAFQPYTNYSEYGCLIKNCPEAIKLMRSYKYRNFEYERRLLKTKEMIEAAD